MHHFGITLFTRHQPDSFAQLLPALVLTRSRSILICCECSCCYYYGRASFRFADAIANSLSIANSVTVTLSIADSNYWYCPLSLLFLLFSPFLVLAPFPPLPTIFDSSANVQVHQPPLLLTLLAQAPPRAPRPLVPTQQAPMPPKTAAAARRQLQPPPVRLSLVSSVKYQSIK